MVVANHYQHHYTDTDWEDGAGRMGLGVHYTDTDWEDGAGSTLYRHRLGGWGWEYLVVHTTHFCLE